MNQIQANRIRDAFDSLQTKYDLLNLLNQVKPLVYGEGCHPFKLHELNYFSFPSALLRSYKSFTIKKKTGADRLIYAPVKSLKAIQRCLNLILQNVFNPHQAAYGFVTGRSVADNARIHVGRRYVYNLDLQDFFPSISQARVWKCLQLEPFNLINSNLIVNNDPILELDDDCTEGGEMIPAYMINDKIYRLKKEQIIPLELFFSKLPDSDSWPKDEVVMTELKGFRVLHRIELTGIPSFPIYIRDGNPFADTPKGRMFVNKRLDITKPMCVVVQGGKLLSSNTSKYTGTLLLDNLSNQKGRRAIADMIAAICTANIPSADADYFDVLLGEGTRALPQGAPTSPVLSNVVCYRMDRRLMGLARRFSARYTRYADDLTFSSDRNVFKEGGTFLEELHRLIALEGFKINQSKVRLQADGHRQEVTGLVVNSKPNVRKKYVKDLRKWLYYWERYGYDRAKGYFKKQYSGPSTDPSMEDVLLGKLNYLGMVKGREDTTYRGVLERYERLRLHNEVVAKEDESGGIDKRDIGKTGSLRNVNKGKPVISVDQLTYWNPSKLSEFLFRMNQDLLLKCLTHKMDGNLIQSVNETLKIDTYDYMAHLGAIKKAYTSLKAEYKGDIPAHTLAKIDAYIYGGKPWSEDKLTVSWSSGGLQEWANLHPGQCPAPDNIGYEGYLFDMIELSSGGFVGSFSDLVMHFKKEVTINGNNRLDDLVQDWALEFSDKADFDFKDEGSRAEVFTDVEKVHQAFKRLINWCIEESPGEKPMIEVYSEDIRDGQDKRTIMLTIWHKNSVFKKSSEDTARRYGSGFTELIRNQINGRCEWLLRADFGGGDFAEICLWPKQMGRPAKQRVLEGFKGVQHCLIFKVS